MDYLAIIKSLSTLAAVIFLGWLSRRNKIFTSEETKTLSAFVYNFALPALFFVEIGRIDYKAAGLVPLAASFLPLVITIVILLVLKATGRISKDRFILLGLCVVFGSNAFFGVPFFESLYGQWGLDMAVLTGSLLSILGIIFSIALFDYASGSQKGVFFLVRILKSPLIAAMAAGAIVHFLKPHANFVPDLVVPLGKVASGLAIFMLGMFIYDHFSLVAIKKAVPLALFRIIVLPLLTFIILLYFQQTTSQLKQFLLLQSGIPAAISIAIFAQRYEYRVGELTGMVVLTSLASFVTLGALYFVSMMYR